MKPLPLLLGLLLPACGSGTDGVATPPPMDMAGLVRPRTPNTALAAPAGFIPTPDVVTPVYPQPAAGLFAAICDVAARQPRTFKQVAYADRLQAHFVARSALLGFPDLVTIAAAPHGAGSATLVIWSRSVYGRSDLGVNRKRVDAWLAALDARA